MTKNEAIICVRKIFGELVSDDYLNEGESEAFMVLLDSPEQTEAAVAAERERIVAERSVDMLLYCPKCFEQHVDKANMENCETCGRPQADHKAVGSAPKGECFVFSAWLNPPHKSHRCTECNHVWRPADVPTNGVLTLETQGKADGSARPVAFANGADFKAAIAAERSRVAAFEWLEQNASEIRAFVQNPDRNIGVGWPVTISVNKYRGEITFHVSGELPGAATSLLDAIQQASTQCVKGGEDA